MVAFVVATKGVVDFVVVVGGELVSLCVFVVVIASECAVVLVGIIASECVVVFVLVIASECVVVFVVVIVSEQCVLDFVGELG